MTNALDDFPQPPARRRLDVDVARPARRRRPAKVSELYVLLVEWALDHGIAEALEKRAHWSQPYGPLCTISGDDREVSLWLRSSQEDREPRIVVRLTATEERWFGPFNDDCRDQILETLRAYSAQRRPETDG